MMQRFASYFRPIEDRVRPEPIVDINSKNSKATNHEQRKSRNCHSDTLV